MHLSNDHVSVLFQSQVGNRKTSLRPPVIYCRPFQIDSRLWLIQSAIVCPLCKCLRRFVPFVYDSLGPLAGKCCPLGFPHVLLYINDTTLCVQIVFHSRLLPWAGCGIRFLIIALIYTFHLHYFDDRKTFALVMIS